MHELRSGRDHALLAANTINMMVQIGSCSVDLESLKSQIPSTKLGTRPQGGESGGPISVIVICLLFDICDLEFSPFQL